MISLGALPYTQYASYPEPIKRDARTILISKQSPYCQSSTFAGDGIFWGYLKHIFKNHLCGGSKLSY